MCFNTYQLYLKFVEKKYIFDIEIGRVFRKILFEKY